MGGMGGASGKGKRRWYKIIKHCIFNNFIFIIQFNYNNF